MSKTMERVVSFLLAPLLLVGMGLLAVTQLPSAHAEDSNSEKTMRIEILPEIFLKPGSKELFSKPEETVGVKRTMDVYGGAPTGQVLEAWKKVAFQVFDGEGNLIETTTGTVGDQNRWSAGKYLGPYKQGEAYTVKVDPSTLPDGYHSWFTALSSGYPEARGGKTDLMTVSKDSQSATNAATNSNPIAETRFHMDYVNIAYTKTPEVAKDLFSLDAEGKVTGLNPKYKAGSDYVLKPIDKDCKVVLPTSAETDKLAAEGYKPGKYYFYYGKKPFPVSAVKCYEGFGYLKKWKGDDQVNTNTKFKTSSVFTVMLDQKIPEVTFYKGAPEEGQEPEVLATQKVYYRHSLGTNCLSDGKTCLPKQLPAAPAAPAGQVFKEWNTKADGSGQAFNADTVVMSNMAVYPVYRPNTPPVLEVKDATITAGDKLDLRSLITKAFDEEDGADLAGKVVIAKGNFDPTKPGTYEVKFTLTDMNGESVSATAKVTVKEAAKTKTPQPDSKVKQQMPPTGAAGISALGIAMVCLLVGIAATAGARVSRKR
ncbi:bacterial Ig-like domain-containing protein [Varibaculum cambriense]|uniref:Ig-like domain-containing protein n=1 Tax=Varibaculum cambriense TaxID=184870 RepID=A0ABX4UTW2_9ACTO|nr:bacterial Ig-like domain-containing protein [Varibaculum cambriense]MDU5317110.1 bacterial Ig-like domain-containing protein [Varibaculum cambriense]MDU5614340.1 bacterial Ig-like domain-containing protein [Varibaculum cambriense]MDU6680370.1 bacterial Ig-like domain-containing protein [Varibaculum cambriense]MDU7408210.1 bacterial Ig-like domain-containing protein [Varibaculum cambriense]PMB90395.1 hypothetical protein CJ240_01260 [Varibaculum cambriense]